MCNAKGRDWEKISSVISTKTASQIESFFYDQNNELDVKGQPLLTCNESAFGNSAVEDTTEATKNDKEKVEKELDKTTIAFPDQESTMTSVSMPSNGHTKSLLQSNLTNANPNSAMESTSNDHTSNYMPHIQQGRLVHNNKITIPHNGAMQNNGSYPFLPQNSRTGHWIPNSNIGFQLEQVPQYVENSDAALWLNDPRNRGHSNVIRLPSMRHYDNMIVQMRHPHVAINTDGQEIRVNNPYFMEFRGNLNQAVNGERGFPDLPINRSASGHAVNRSWGNERRYSPHKDVN